MAKDNDYVNRKQEKNKISSAKVEENVKELSIEKAEASKDLTLDGGIKKATKSEKQLKREKDLVEQEENNFFKFLGNILYWIVFVLVAIILIIVAVQRFSDNKEAVVGFRIFRVQTGSMEPEYVVGDVLLAKETQQEDIKKGDNIVYKGKEAPFTNLTVTHEVIKKWEKDGVANYITKGIANDIEDPAITHDQVYGKVIYKFAIISMLSKAILSNQYVFFFLVFVPIAFLIVMKIIEVAKEDVDDD